MLMSVAMACAAMAAVAAAVVVWQKMQRPTSVVQGRDQALVLLYEFQHACATPLHVLRQVAEHMAIEMHAGLMTEGKSNLMMLPTFVERLPNGYVCILYVCMAMAMAMATSFISQLTLPWSRGQSCLPARVINLQVMLHL